jgi:acylphosphatase
MTTAQRKRARVVVAGRVQGVGFRYWVSRQAAALNVDGWVRNLPGGDVEAVLAGEPRAVDRLIAACWNGPSAAFVHRVDETPDAPEPGQGFRIAG